MPDRVLQVFADVLRLPIEGLNDETSPENTQQWDSVKAIDLALAIEDEFGVKLSTREIVSMRNIAIVRKVLRAKGVEDA